MMHKHTTVIVPLGIYVFYVKDFPLHPCMRDFDLEIPLLYMLSPELQSLDIGQESLSLNLSKKDSHMR